MPTISATIPIRLTHAQRRVVANLLPELATRLLLDTTTTRTIHVSTDEVEAIQQIARASISNAATGMIRNSLRHIVEATNKGIESTSGIGAIPKSERLYQFRISLKEFKPEIWRRIQVRDCTLDKLHEHIQTAMGWTNSHLHQFDIQGERYGDPELLDDGFEDFVCVDSTVTKLSELVPQDGKRFQFGYEYDFGDGWEHDVVFEGCLVATKGQPYPICLEGERACPPEDVGGVGGYEDFLAAIADPEHEEHESFLEWSGGSFSADEFDPRKATREMKKGLPDWRRM